MTPAVAPPRAELEEIRRRLIEAVARVCPSWMTPYRDDLAQAAILRILELERREGNRSFSSSYLRKVAYAVLVDEIRRLRRRAEIPLELETGPSEVGSISAKPTSPSPEQQATNRQLGAGIASCLHGIKAERRQALVLYLQGHTVPEAARILGFTTKKTENLVYRGRADLQRCLESKGLKP